MATEQEKQESLQHHRLHYKKGDRLFLERDKDGEFVEVTLDQLVAVDQGKDDSYILNMVLVRDNLELPTFDVLLFNVTGSTIRALNELINSI